MKSVARVIFFIFSVFALISLSSFWYGDKEATFPKFQTHDTSTGQDPVLNFKGSERSIKEVRNSTLGFQQVFVLNFPDRPDKLDGFSSASAATGITAETIEAIRGQAVADDTLPSTEGLPTKEGQRDDVVGSWRSHLNFAREVVNRRLSTALIMEDDADWDTSLKSQLALFAQASQYILGVGAKNGRTWSPYGDDWDLLWLGHCGSTIKPNDPRRFIVENDDTVPDPRRRLNQPMRGLVKMAEEGYDNHTRVFYETESGRCTHAYGLSYRGARRVLATVSSARRFESFDAALSRICTSEPRFKCLSVFPQLIGSFQKLEADDDTPVSQKELARLGTGTPNIVHSTRLNMNRLLAGNKENFERQWPNDPQVEGAAQTRTLNRGT